jgi:AraC-like DNA-binding protein
MLTHDHLTLSIVTLKSEADWAHRQEGLVFVFPRAGTGGYAVGRVVQPLTAGTVLVANSDRAGIVTAAAGQSLSFGCFFLRPEHLFPLFAAEEVSLLERVTDNLHSPKLYLASSPVARLCYQLLPGQPEAQSLQHRSQLLRVAAVVLAEEFRAARDQHPGYQDTEERLRHALENLSTDQLLGCSVEDLAARLACSRRQLNRLFQNCFGLSVSAMKMEMRMLRAVSLLRNPDAKVLIIAEQCGFSHLGLFHICFKKRFGLSPSQWRNKNLASEIPSPKARAINPTCLLAAKTFGQPCAALASKGAARQSEPPTRARA